MRVKLNYVCCFNSTRLFVYHPIFGKTAHSRWKERKASTIQTWFLCIVDTELKDVSHHPWIVYRRNVILKLNPNFQPIICLLHVPSAIEGKSFAIWELFLEILRRIQG